MPIGNVYEKKSHAVILLDMNLLLSQVPQLPSDTKKNKLWNPQIRNNNETHQINNQQQLDR